MFRLPDVHAHFRQFVDMCEDAQLTTGWSRDLDLCTCWATECDRLVDHANPDALYVQTYIFASIEQAYATKQRAKRATGTTNLLCNKTIREPAWCVAVATAVLMLVGLVQFAVKVGP